MALHAFEGRYDLPAIRRWLKLFLERFFANQFKRDCMPDAPKVGSGGSLSPRGDWRMPSDASVAAWLAELETIPLPESAAAEDDQAVRGIVRRHRDRDAIAGDDADV
jgi:hypothetical protein